MKIIMLVLGGLLIAAGLIYGFTDTLQSSIPERSDHIARLEREQMKLLEKSKAVMAGTVDSRSIDEVERLTREIKFRGEIAAFERDQKKTMSIITAAFVAAGLIAMLLGWRMRKRTA